MTLRAALITGATSGLGRAMAMELGRRGTFVHVLGRRAELLEELIAELPSGGASYAVDVTDSAALRLAMEQADSSQGGAPGPLDLVIANAGIAEGGIQSIDAADAAAQVFGVNTIAATTTIEYAKGLMLPRGKGQLCAISSLAGTRGLPGAPAYCASKAALSCYVESLRFELRGTGLAITDVQPGFVKTAMTDLNAFPMPFLMDLNEAACRTVDAIYQAKPPATLRYPRRLAWPLRLAAKAAPNWLWQAALKQRT